MTEIKENEAAWKLATQLGRIANLLDLWADECLSGGWNISQVEPMRNLAREIRDELQGFVPSKETLEAMIAYHEKCTAKLKQELTDLLPTSSERTPS